MLRASAAKGEVERFAPPVRERELYEHYQRLVQRTIDVFGDELTASRWLSTPSEDFAGQVPLDLARRDSYSLAFFEPIFVRIEHGIDFDA